MQARQHALHRAVAKYGIAYTVVLPGTMAAADGSTVPQPVIRPVSPRRLTALYADDVDDEWPVYAVEERTLRNDKGAIRTVFLYDDQYRYTLVGKQDDPRLYWADQAGGLPRRRVGRHPVGLPTIEEHGLGVCPVVRLLARPRPRWRDGRLRRVRAADPAAGPDQHDHVQHADGAAVRGVPPAVGYGHGP